MKKPWHLLLLTVLLCSSVIADSISTNLSTSYWSKGISAARSNQPDSAQKYLKAVFNQGISDDSLFYLWAEVYLNQGKIDTALALNLSIKLVHTSLKKPVVEQRYLIYTSLGWDKEAKALLDSTDIRRTPSYLHYLIPECAFYISGGGYGELDKADNNYPYSRDSDSSMWIRHGTGYGSVKLGWTVPAFRQQKIRFGSRLRYSGSRFTVASRSVQGNDSADASVGAYVNYSLFSDQLAAGYQFSRKRDYLGDYSSVHLGTVQGVLFGDTWMGSVEGGCQYEFPSREKYGYILGWWNRDIDKKNSVSAELFLSGFITGPYRFASASYWFVYADSGVAYRNANHDTLSRNSTNHLVVIDSIGTFGLQQIGRSYLSAAPTLRWERTFGKKYLFGCGLGYVFTWFKDRYAWVDYRYPDESPPLPSTGLTDWPRVLALNSIDGEYYWTQTINARTAKIVLDSKAVGLGSRRRVDQSLSGDVFLKRSFGKIGDGMLAFTVKRNFSTLMDAAPVDIQKWYGELRLSWYFKYRPVNVW